MNKTDIKLIPFTLDKTFETITEIPQGVSMIKAPEYWAKGKNGRGVKIAIIDTGCDINHPDLKDRIIGGRNFTTDDNGDSNIFADYNGHGTHVAGTIAASRNESGVLGVAPEASLLILKALDKDGVGNIQWIIDAIYYAIELKVDIISMSLGIASDIPDLHTAIKRAVKNNILVVCSAGNDGFFDYLGDKEDFNYPSNYNEVISVGAVDFERYTTWFTNSNNNVDLVAPGKNILSTAPDGKYAILSGTSMATPHVSGALALIINWAEEAFGRKLTEPELYAQLIKRTVSLNYKKTIVGNGLLYLTVSEISENLISIAKNIL